MSAFVVLDLPRKTDARGSLVVMEKLLPFAISRAFWIVGADGQVRGGHRHIRNRQALVAVQGEVTVHLDDGMHRADVVLERPDQCLLVEPEDWHTMAFGAGAVLLVFASHPYDPGDYVTEGDTR